MRDQKPATMPILFTTDNRLQSWTAITKDDKLNAKLAGMLAKNAAEKKEELLKAALKDALGKVPTLGEAAKHLDQRHDPATGLTWYCWKGKAIAVGSDPISSVKGSRYVLTWLWKNLNEKN
jgi:hypothetical protein